MRYSDPEHDRALEQIHRDATRQHRDRRRRAGFRITLALLLAAATLLLCTACNTIGGIGADLEAAARGTQQWIGDQQTPPRPIADRRPD